MNFCINSKTRLLGGLRLRIHYLLHDHVADLGNIKSWVSEKGYSTSYTKLDENVKFPSIDDFDLLIILGGRMGAYEEEKHSWLAIRKTVLSDK